MNGSLFYMKIERSGNDGEIPGISEGLLASQRKKQKPKNRHAE